MSRNLFIVVEGPDASGKTSIAKELAKKIKANYFERSKQFKADISKQHNPEYYEGLGRKLSNHLRGKLEKSSLIIARYFYSISALIYANTGKRRRLINDVLKPDYVIYCYANKKILRNRIKERSDKGDLLYGHEEEIDKYNRLCKRYDELFKKKKNIIKINTSNRTVKESVDYLVNKLEKIL